MSGLRSEFGGPQFEPHVTVVGVVRLTEEETRDKFRRGCEGVKKVYSVNVEKVDIGTFFISVFIFCFTQLMRLKKINLFIV
ncbi:hypothetical protein MTR67_048792 [Solanum verrucosum]|uniref:Cyclic phosphodiesterase n=1 Tax=Solanum verrucosum TaxID=315347 RepID=A0AAF0UZL3_SOLVR|nr:hypothetical protein MTR67_048792 [Solanum verrucosum]